MPVKQPNKLFHYRVNILGLSQTELAKASKVSAKTIHKVEKYDEGSSVTRGKLLSAINKMLRAAGRDSILASNFWESHEYDSEEDYKINEQTELFSNDAFIGDGDRSLDLDSIVENQSELFSSEYAIANNKNGAFSENIGARRSVLYAAQMLLEPLRDFKELVEGDNYLNIEYPEVKSDLLEVLDRLIAHMNFIINKLSVDQEIQDKESINNLVDWAEQTYSHTVEDFKDYVSPESVGKIVAPTTITLGLGIIGALFGGAAGFAGGTLVGNVIIRNSKPKDIAEEFKSNNQSD